MTEPAAPAKTAILLVDCPDRKGIVASIGGFLYRHGANILHADQHQDNRLGLFFLRVGWDLGEFDLDRAALLREFEPLARAVRWHLEHRILCYGNKTVVFD
jgi:formyltetrahydrofolate deformylase